jgi:ABC-type Fe3+/spermidine/putrescine transport system ATPase subunit
VLIAAKSTVVNAGSVLHVAGSDPNPHLWYDIPKVPRVAAAITAALIEAAPQDSSSVTLWSDLTLTLTSSEFLAVLGPNGVDKTTLLKLLLGLVPISSGLVRVNGAPPRRGNNEVGYIPQKRAFDQNLPIRARDLVRFRFGRSSMGSAGALTGIPPAR